MNSEIREILDDRSINEYSKEFKHEIRKHLEKKGYDIEQSMNKRLMEIIDEKELMEIAERVISIEINGIKWEQDDYNPFAIIAYKNDEPIGHLYDDTSISWYCLLTGIDLTQEFWEDGYGNILTSDGWGTIEIERSKGNELL